MGAGEADRQLPTPGETEERLRIAREAAGLGLWDWHIDSDRAWCSESYFSLFGLPPDRGLLSQEDWLALVHPADRGRAKAEVRQSLEERAPYDTEYRVVWPDGTVHWLSSKSKVFFDDEGRPVRMFGAMADVTERRERAEALKREITLRRARERELELANADLQQALEQVKTLQGMIPMCAGCQKIRDDDGYWQRVGDYLAKHTGVAIAHGRCPECHDKFGTGSFPAP